MSILNIAMSLATSQSDKLARFLGKSPADVKRAMEQGKKLLPEILNNPNAEGGAKVLSDLGVDKSFVNDIFKRYGSFGSKVGLSKGSIESAINNLGRAMDNRNHGAPKSPTQKKPKGFDSSRYPSL